jgi:hypothetical protein
MLLSGQMNARIFICAAFAAGLITFGFYRRVVIPLTRPEFRCPKCGRRLWSVKSFHISPPRPNVPGQLFPSEFFGLWQTRRYQHESMIFASCRWCKHDWEVLEGKPNEIWMSTFRYHITCFFKPWQIERPVQRLR